MMLAWLRNASALLAGILFGAGLAIAQMTDPRKVLAFLDLAGDWDPSLAMTMAGALLVTALGYRLFAKRSKSLAGNAFALPAAVTIDKPLLIGAACFGVGWGIAGYCPGPAIAALGQNSTEPWLFLAAMIAGSLLASVIGGMNSAD